MKDERERKDLREKRKDIREKLRMEEKERKINDERERKDIR